MLFRKCCFVFCVFLFLNSNAQNERLIAIKQHFDELSIGSYAPGLNDKVDITLTNSSLQTFLAGIGKAHKLNILVDPSIDQNVSINFTNEQVKSLLYYVCQKYDLDVQFTGAIMSFYRPKKEIVITPKKLNINVNTEGLFTLDLQNDTLSEVVKQLTKLSSTNILLDPDVRDRQTSGYIQNQAIEGVIEKLSYANNLEYKRNKDSSFSISPFTEDKNSSTNGNGFSNNLPNKNATNNSPRKAKSSSNLFKVEKGQNGEQLITVDAINQPIAEIIKSVSDNLNLNYIFQSDIQGSITASLEKVTYDQLVTNLFKGTNYTYKLDNKIYLFGERPKEGLRDSRVIALQFRPVKDVIEAIPKEIIQGIQVSQFPELNSIILSGASPVINEVEAFIKNIDKPVPVITIEIMILDIKKLNQIEGGLKAGLGNAPTKDAGTILPGIDFTVGSNTLNDIFDKIGLTAIGKLMPNFYVGIKALENNGYLNIQSTPKLSTLNGHKASINIGEMSYYLEQSQNIVGVQNPQTVVTNVYKPVNADFTIDIEPVVSGNEFVTLTVKVNQSDFTARVNETGPPGTTTRKFESMIRVRNEEVVLLGGLERVEKSDTGSGWPFLSRVPFLKWIFGSRVKKKQKTKLLVLIKPSILY